MTEDVSLDGRTLFVVSNDARGGGEVAASVERALRVLATPR